MLLRATHPSRSPSLAPRARFAAAWLGWLLPLTFAFAGPDNSARAFRVSAGPASETLKQVAEQAQREILFPSEPVADVRTHRVVGDYTPREALDRMLAGTRLRALEAADTGGIVIAPAAADSPASPNPMKTKSTLAAIAGWFALGAATAVPAQPPTIAPGTGSGTIAGRVFNPDSGEYVERARITIDGTTLETFTDAEGFYRLGAVPVGAARVRAFRTGTVSQTHVVSVAAGQIAERDFTLSAHGGGDGTVKLAEFVVGTSREMSGAAIAINTQRFAPNVMNVVAADEFGPVASGNVGEVLRSVPGVTVELGGLGAPYTISLNGVPPGNVPVTIGGMNVADSAQGTSRTSGVHQLSINNMARIEVAYTPTPETSGSALAGSVNFVPRSALERSKPSYNVTASLLMRDRERSFARTAGPRREPTRKITSELNLSAVVPLTPRFGFTLSASTFETYAPNHLLQRTWRGANAATNGGTLPDTTPDRPYLTDFAIRDRVAFIRRSTAAGTLDFKLSPRDRISLSLQHGAFRSPNENQTLTFLVNRVAPGEFGPAFTRGFVGAGEIRLNKQANNQDDQLWMPGINYWHKGPVWTAEAGAGFSDSLRWTTDIQNSHWGTALARRQNVTVSFDDITALGPRRLTVTDGATGAVIDPFSLAPYLIQTAGANTGRRHALQQKIFGHASRQLLGLTAKAGFDVNRAMRDVRVYQATFTFVGADGRAGTADDAAAPFLDAGMSRRAGVFGYPQMERVSSDRLHDLYRAQPGQFQVGEAAVHNTTVAQSKHAEETIAAAYFRGDLALMQGRLKLVGGLRAEQTNVKGEGQLIDPTRNFQHDAAGRIVTVASPTPADPSRRVPALLNPAGSLAAVRLTNIDRGLRAEKESLRWFPSLNASYNLRENLIARAGYYWSVGRPDYVQYAGSLTLPDTEQLASPANRIVVNNAGIKAWSAQTWKATLEYYFAEVGLLSVAGFAREIENFFGATTFRPSADFLALYGLDPAVYGSYDAQTQSNLPGKVRMSGVDVNYKHALTFLPHWARGLQVFANGSVQRATGEAADNFSGYLPRTANWGVSLTRPQFALRAKWNWHDRARRGLVATARGLEASTYNWRSARTLLDLSGDYVLSRHFTLFFNLSNVNDNPVVNEIAGPSTPDYARIQQYERWGSLWTFGVKGTF
ncbi:MAG: TonB-dependent receptor [Opitutaceae bacterium]|nr:TonB-dependent receptor [Opitutaceae bacterium]